MVMPFILICEDCEQRLTEASNLVHRHARQMHSAIHVAGGSPTEELQELLRHSLVASFREAQSAWDAYCEHLAKNHGSLLPPLSYRRDAALH